MTYAFQKSHMAVAVIVGTVLSLVLVFSPSAKVNATRITIPLNLEDFPAEENAALSTRDLTKQNKLQHNILKVNVPNKINTPIAKPSLSENWDTFTVKKGHTLSSLFSLAGYNDGVMYSVLGPKNKNKALSKIFPGEKLAFLRNKQEQLVKINLVRSQLESVLFSKQSNGQFESQTITRTPDIHISYSEGTIDSSLFLAGEKAGLSQSQIMELANIFGWDIDFILDIRSGDKFNLIYQELFLDGQKFKNGKILAASFTNNKRTLKAVLYQQPSGMSNYFTPDGKSMRKAFIRSPVDFARVSSRFNLKRKHPILHRIRAHKGTDYAAARGTPIKATGDGKIIHAGRKGGYGRAVIIQHGQKFSTLYAHLSKFSRGIRSGKRVKQGQTIGYIGSTGLATGPHLHYEFRVNGVHKNSLKVKLPHARPIPNKELAAFKEQTSAYLSQLLTFSESYQLASRK